MAIREGAADMVALLNDMLERDPGATSALVRSRVPCNQAMVDHPTVQTGRPEAEGAAGRLGILGVLNGFFGCYDDGPRAGWGAISALVEADGTVARFEIVPNEEAAG